jgi:hypothetical protein
MRRFQQIKRLAAALVLATIIPPGLVSAEPVAERHAESAVHGFLVLRSLDDKALANGDLVQIVCGHRVTQRLVFHFSDDSLFGETTVYSQHQQFRLISYHLVSRGPEFLQPLETLIASATGQVTVRYSDAHGEQKGETKNLNLPADLANGIVPKLLMNARSGSMPKTVSLIAATSKPTLVKVAITAAGPDRFSIGDSARQATHYVLKVELDGITGLLAPLVGKQPPDSHVWILGGDVPAFVRSEQPLYLDGTVWRIELARPVWPKGSVPPITRAAAPHTKERT